MQQNSNIGIFWFITTRPAWFYGYYAFKCHSKHWRIWGRNYNFTTLCEYQTTVCVFVFTGSSRWIVYFTIIIIMIINIIIVSIIHILYPIKEALHEPFKSVKAWMASLSFLWTGNNSVSFINYYCRFCTTVKNHWLTSNNFGMVVSKSMLKRLRTRPQFNN